MAERSEPAPTGRRRHGWKLAAAAAVVGLSAYGAHVWHTLPDVTTVEKKNPGMTALMEEREREAKERGHHARRDQVWVPLAQVPQHVIDAVLLSEDASFYVHQGVDLDEMKDALSDAVDRRELGRGASTLTMQLAKNLWLSTDRSLVRKLKEVVLARRMERALSKRRILTLYLNVVEWGEGVYGIEAAARAHFGLSASALSLAQAAILASMLPAPRRWSPAAPSEALRARVSRLLHRMEIAGRADATAVAIARLEAEQLLGSLDG